MDFLCFPCVCVGSIHLLIPADSKLTLGGNERGNGCLLLYVRRATVLVVPCLLLKGSWYKFQPHLPPLKNKMLNDGWMALKDKHVIS